MWKAGDKMIEKLYTVEEVAELASVTGRTIRNYLKSGRLVGRKIGGQWRFPEIEVQRLLTGALPEPDITPSSGDDYSSVSSSAFTEDSFSAPSQDEPAPVPIAAEELPSDPEPPEAPEYINFPRPAPLPSAAPPPPIHELAPPPQPKPEPAAPVADIPASQPAPSQSAKIPARSIPQAPEPAPRPEPEPVRPIETTPVAAAAPVAPAPPPVVQAAHPVQVAAQPPATASSVAQPAAPPPVQAAEPPAPPAPTQSYYPSQNPQPQPIVPASTAPEQSVAIPIPVYQAPSYPVPQQTPPVSSIPIYAVPPTTMTSQTPYAPPASSASVQNQPEPPSAAPQEPPVYYNSYYPYPPQPLWYPGFGGSAYPPQPSAPDTSPLKPSDSYPAEDEEPFRRRKPARASYENAAPSPEFSDVGKKVSRFISEVHDCTHGPMVCAVVDMHQSLSSAQATGERLADISAQESETGVLCQSYVEFDERYFVARYTLFGSSSFLFRCLKLIG